MTSSFVYNETYELLICIKCKYALMPSTASQKRHLRREHNIQGQRRATLLQVFQGYGHINGPDDLGHLNTVIPPIPHLEIHQIYRCRLCDNHPPTRNIKLLNTHISNIHKTAPRDQRPETHYRQYSAQTFFKETKNMSYFEVSSDIPSSSSIPPPSTLFDDFFKSLKENRKQEELATVQLLTTINGFAAHKSEEIPWLSKMGIHEHLQGLPVERVIALARPKLEEATGQSMFRGLIIYHTQKVLEEAYRQAQPGPDTTLSRPTLTKIAQLQVNGNEPDSTGTHFRPVKEAATLAFYFQLWTQFMMYYLDVTQGDRSFKSLPASPSAEDGDDSTPPENPRTSPHLLWWPELPTRPVDSSIPQDSIRFPEKQRSLCEDFADYIEDLETWKSTGLDHFQRDEAKFTRWGNDGAMALFTDILTTTTGPNAFTSPLISFASLQAVKFSSKTFLEANEFSHYLSALIWVSQLLLVAVAVNKCKKETGSTDEASLYTGKAFDTYARHHHETPIGHLLGWRSLAKEVAKTSGQFRQALWSADGTSVSYNGTLLKMTEVTSLLVHEYNKAAKLLFEDLLFGAPNVVRLRGYMFHDNPHEDMVGLSLVDLNRSSTLHIDALEEVIQKSRTLRLVYLQQRGDDIFWKRDAMEHYEATVQTFLRHLLVLIHISAGQPLRQGELLSVKWQNTQNQRRSIFVHDGHVMLRVTYHKSQAVTGKPKDNMRFLPPCVGNLLLDFLVYVQTLRKEFLRQQCPGSALPPFLWSTQVKVWQDDKLTKSLQSASKAAKIPELNVATWRQMTVAIVKAKFRTNLIYFDVDPGDEVPDEDELDFRAMNEQRNHTMRTANLSYANQHSYGGMGDEAVQRNRKASELWSDFFRIEAEVRANSKRPLAEVGSGDEDSGLNKRINAGRLRKKQSASVPELLATARKLYDDDKFTFRPNQNSALKALMHGYEIVVAILPTGYGKSLLFMVPCALPDAAVTILVLPLVSLRVDMVRRLRELRIQHTIWTEHVQHRTGLVIVSVEAAMTKAFYDYALTLISAQKLDRIVVDECHLTITAATYRSSMTQLPRLRFLPTQFLYLTATMPPSMYEEFCKVNHCPKAIQIREPSNRANIRYSVIKSTLRRQSLLETAQRLILEHHYRDAHTVPYINDDRIIIYCTSIKVVQELAELLGCESYTSATGDEQQKQEVISRWLSSGSLPYIVATSALGVGFDYAHVRKVWHIDAPRSLVDFAQESGRAGRDGSPASSVVLLDAGWRPQENAMGNVPADRAAMHHYLTDSGCLRSKMGYYLDGEDHEDSLCTSNSPMACSLCMAGRPNPPPTQLSATPPCGQGFIVARSPTPSSTPPAAIIRTSNPPPSSPRFSSSAITLTPGPRTNSGLMRAPLLKSRPRFVSAASTPTPSRQTTSKSYIMPHTGRALILSEDRQNQSVLDRFQTDLRCLLNTCTMCRAQGRAHDHLFSHCKHKNDFLNHKTKQINDTNRGRNWFPAYHVCYHCYLPQSICGRAAASAATRSQQPRSLHNHSAVEECEFPDMILPWLWGRWKVDSDSFSFETLEVLKTEKDLFTWIAVPQQFGGDKGTRGAVFMASYFKEHPLILDD